MSEPSSPQIEWADFARVEMRVGTVLNAALNLKARKPSYVLEIDFGDYGVKTSSAQLTVNYTPEQLIGTQVVAVLNFPPKRIAGVESQVLVLGALSQLEDVVLLRPTKAVENGARIG